VKSSISNGWESRIVDPDSIHGGKLNRETDNVIDVLDIKCWPKSPYTQQIEGVLPDPSVLTEEVITDHLQSPGKCQRRTSLMDYLDLQRGHQY